MKVAIVIPARMASTRLPGKMLLEAAGKPLIQHTHERAALVSKATRIIVATDDDRIAAAVRGFGGEAVLTDSAHTSGSARVAEAAHGLGSDLIVNLQGDEPEIDPGSIDALIALAIDRKPFTATLACPFPAAADPNDPNAVKAVLGRRLEDGVHEALYFTRARAPYPRDGGPGEHHLHIGIYAFRADALATFAKTPESRLERIERLEQLRILEMGERMLVRLVGSAAPGIDTPSDFAAFKARVEA